MKTPTSSAISLLARARSLVGAPPDMHLQLSVMKARTLWAAADLETEICAAPPTLAQKGADTA